VHSVRCGWEKDSFFTSTLLTLHTCSVTTEMLLILHRQMKHVFNIWCQLHKGESIEQLYVSMNVSNRPASQKLPIRSIIPPLWFPLLSYSCWYSAISKTSVWGRIHNNPLHSNVPVILVPPVQRPFSRLWSCKNWLHYLSSLSHYIATHNTSGS